jgi:hypothetical protein
MFRNYAQRESVHKFKLVFLFRQLEYWTCLPAFDISNVNNLEAGMLVKNSNFAQSGGASFSAEFLGKHNEKIEGTGKKESRSVI